MYSNPPFFPLRREEPQFYVVSHFHGISDISESYLKKLDFDISAAK